MRKLTVSLFTSLDGVIQAPGGPDEDRSGGFQFGGWTVPYADDVSGQCVMDLLAAPFELLLGRCTYDIFAAYWPKISADANCGAIAEPFNRVAKHVATHHPESLAWHNSHALQGSLADAVRALKQQDGDNLVTFGSGNMVRQLLAAGLVDELQMMVYPVMLGRGKRVFGDDALPSSFTVEQTAATPDGMIITRYVRGGEVRTGSF